MLKTPLGGWNAARLELGGKQMGRTEYLFAGSLGLIIALALGLTIYSQMRGDNDMLTSGPPHWKCYDCGYELVYDPKTMTNPQGGPAVGPGMMPPDAMMGPGGGADCPKCHHKGTFWPETECPKCHTFFLPDRRLLDTRGGPPPAGMKLICPKCGIDINAYYLEKIKNR